MRCPDTCSMQSATLLPPFSECALFSILRRVQYERKMNRTCRAEQLSTSESRTNMCCICLANKWEQDCAEGEFICYLPTESVSYRFREEVLSSKCHVVLTNQAKSWARPCFPWQLWWPYPLCFLYSQTIGDTCNISLCKREIPDELYTTAITWSYIAC